MADYRSYIKKYRNLSVRTMYDDFRAPKDPLAFPYRGSQVYHGLQGRGKTLSMYYHFRKMKMDYPKLLVVSNLNLLRLEPVSLKEPTLEALNALMPDDGEGSSYWEEHYIRFSSYDDLMVLLRHCRNGKFGVVFLIDEIHNYFHSHDSKGVPMWVVQVFSQQRKQKLLVIGTAQKWGDIALQIRSQFENIIGCNISLFGYRVTHASIKSEQLSEEYGSIVADENDYKMGGFWIDQETRDGYDTFQVIDSGRKIMGGDELKITVNSGEQNSRKKFIKYGQK